MKNVKIVLGCSFGDEGKGGTVAHFTRKMRDEHHSTPLVIFHNGTAQRGHTVDYVNGYRHVFHHFGSGSLDGGLTFFAKDFLIHPMEYRREYQEIERETGYALPNTYCSFYCDVITPFDMMVDRATEEWIAIQAGEREHGSCGFGSWCAVEDRFPMSRSNFKIIDWMKATKEEYEAMMRIVWDDCVEILNKRGVDLERTSYRYFIQKVNRETTANHFWEDLKFFIYHNEFKDWQSMWQEFDDFIFENGQGLGLDKDVDNDWHTTSYTGLTNPVKMLANPATANFNAEVCYVTRSYSTRHGKGPLADEVHKKEINANMIDKTNVFNDFQGGLRFGYLNDRDMQERIDKDWAKVVRDSRFIKSMVITHCNEFPDEKKSSKYYSDNPFEIKERK